MRSLIFGILGAVTAALYWRYTVYAHPAMLQVDWIDVLIYTAAGFVVGWVVGFAISKIGHHDL